MTPRGLELDTPRDYDPRGANSERIQAKGADSNKSSNLNKI